MKYNSKIVIVNEIYWKLVRHFDAACTKSEHFLIHRCQH
ncbi:hypothetical protein EAKF1_ch4302c [Escherichia albertii KF1]|nr:hypothetical protein EAKF1_ch4302c [Escherichia albertii KF1]